MLSRRFHFSAWCRLPQYVDDELPLIRRVGRGQGPLVPVELRRVGAIVAAPPGLLIRGSGPRWTPLTLAAWCRARALPPRPLLRGLEVQ